MKQSFEKENGTIGLQNVITKVLNNFFGKQVDVRKIGKNVHIDYPPDVRVTRPLLLFSEGEYAIATPLQSIKAFDKKITFTHPNLTALYLSKRAKSYRELNKQWIDIKKSFYKSPNNSVTLDIESESKLFDYIENFHDVIVYSYAALEAFTNLSIPDLYEIEHRREKDKGEKIYSKENIQRYWSLSEKIEFILPEIFECAPLSSNLVSEFKQVEKLRHIIIHNKDGNYQNIFSNLFNEQILKHSLNCTVKIIEHFASSKSPIINAVIPFGFNDNKLYILPVPDFEGFVEEVEIEE